MRRTVFKVFWTHPTLDGERCGADSDWSDRESADHAAQVIRDAGGRDVVVKRWDR
jgi:hypothetical protein